MDGDWRGPYETASLPSVAHLFPRGKGRRGLYVLTFANGERYGGQTVDIVRRYGDHRRRWSDITSVAFLPIPRGDLDGPETDLIHRFRLDSIVARNVTHSLVTGSRDRTSDLDVLIPEAEQLAWLEGGEDPVDARAVDDPRMRAAGRDKFAALERHPLGAAAMFVAQLYVQWALLRPRLTEMTFWAASAMPSTNRSVAPRLLAVSVNTMETLVLMWDKGEPTEMWGFLNVRKSTLLDHYGSVEEFARPRQDWLDVDDATYQAGGGDVLRIDAYDAESLFRLLIDEGSEGILRAAADLTYHLMRKGPTLQWRWHNFALADRLLEPIAAE
jgi:hypothetical protein